MNTTEITSDELSSGIQLADVLVRTGIVKSKGEAKRLMSQKGIYLNDAVVEDPFYVLNDGDFTDNEAIVRKGKKIFHRLKIK